jgi:competence protein ComEC
METGFFSRRRLEKARLAPIFALAAFAFLGAARMEAGLQEEAIVREEGTFGFSELAARAEGTAETIQEKDGRVSVQLKDVKAAVRKTDPGRESAETESEGKEEKTKEITKEKTKKKESADGQEEWKEYELDRLLVYLPPEEIGKEELLPGMKLLCMGELEIFEPARNAGEFDYRLYYRSRHICCRMSAKKAEITDRSADPLKAAAYSFRERAREALKQFCTEKDAGLLSAVLLGDKTQMDEEINDLYQKNGIAHLLAVSGVKTQNLAIPLTRRNRINSAFVPLHIAKIYILKLCLDEEIIPRCRFPCSRGYFRKCINWQKKQ